MDTVKLSAAIEGFLLEKEAQGRSPRTIADYKNTLTKFLTKLGDVPVSSVTKQEIQDYFRWLTKYKYSPVNSQKPTKPLQPKTLENARCTINSFWLWSTEEFSISNPFKMPRFRFDEAPIVPLTLDEVAKMLEACDKGVPKKVPGKKEYYPRRPTRIRDRAIVLVFFDCGVRVSELINIRYADLDLVNKRIFVTGKGKKRRHVYFSSTTAQALWRHQSHRFRNTDPFPDDYLFVQRNGISPMNRFAIHLLIERIGQRAGIEKMHPHRLRHTFAVTYLRNGGDPFSLQNLLGHTNMEMTKRYINLAKEDMQSIYRRVSPADSLMRR